jgi:hypothetical protein
MSDQAHSSPTTNGTDEPEPPFEGILQPYMRILFGTEHEDRAREIEAEAKALAAKTSRRSDFRAQCNMTQLAGITATTIAVCILGVLILARVTWLIWTL